MAKLNKLKFAGIGSIGSEISEKEAMESESAAI